jgi:hypothetical protein
MSALASAASGSRILLRASCGSSIPFRRLASLRLRYFPATASYTSLSLNASLYRIASLIFSLLM